VGTVKVPEALPAAEDCAESVPTNNDSITWWSKHISNSLNHM
jgi:hypothetical protein